MHFLLQLHTDLFLGLPGMLFLGAMDLLLTPYADAADAATRQLFDILDRALETTDLGRETA